MMSYQVTAILCNAKRETGIEFEIDSELEAGEFVVVGDPDIEKFVISSTKPWETVLFLVTMGDSISSPIKSFLTSIPILRHITLFLLARKWAKKLL